MEIINIRIKKLKVMHNTIINIGNEDIYCEWIEYGVPDEPTDDMLVNMAMSDNIYFDTHELFLRLMEYLKLDDYDEYVKAYSYYKEGCRL